MKSNDSMILACLKADAYGQGMLDIAKHISSMVDYFAVAYLEEGVSLRSIDKLTPILIFIFSRYDIAMASKYNLTMSISSIDELAYVINETINRGYVIDVHLAINSGMNRYGFDSIDDVRNAVDILSNVRNVRLTGMYTHLYDDNIDNNIHQIEIFDRYIKIVRNNYKGDVITHVLASHGIANINTKHDMTRLGISMYVASNLGTRDAVVIKSTIQSVREVKKGEFVGYSCHYKADCDIIVAVVYGGYADGIDKRLTGMYVDIEGQRARIIGDVCMDVFFVDITNIKNAHIGSDVTIVGGTNTIEQVARYMHATTYEVLTNIKGRYIRSYI